MLKKGTAELSLWYLDQTISVISLKHQEVVSALKKKESTSPLKLQKYTRIKGCVPFFVPVIC